jgi:hypothetical protein
MLRMVAAETARAVIAGRHGFELRLAAGAAKQDLMALVHDPVRRLSADIHAANGILRFPGQARRMFMGGWHQTPPTVIWA